MKPPEQGPTPSDAAGMALRPEAGSFKDPAGRVYRLGGAPGAGRIVRGLRGEGLANAQRLLAEPFFQDLMRDGDVVQTRLLGGDEAALAPLIAAGWQGAIEHDPIGFPSWPYEWPFAMLRDAALLQLRLLDASVRNGWILKDATPFNEQWQGVRPTFIDVPSFVPRDGRFWRAYRQFNAAFLTPLLLTAHLGVPFQPLLRARLDEGVPAEEAARYFRGMRRFRRGVLSHVWFPAKAERASARRKAVRPPSSPAGQRQSRKTLLALIDSLRRLVGGLAFRPASNEWIRYPRAHSYSDADYARKGRFVAERVAARKPGVVWDLGANTGAMARIAARSAGLVVAMDRDHAAADALYRRLRDEGAPRNILPLVMDVANPSPAQGWAGRERAGLAERGRPDLVLCLALLHHLRAAANVPLALILDWLRSLAAPVLLEFVAPEDEMFARLVARKDEPCADYDGARFNHEVARRFRVRERLRLKGGLRELLLLEPR